MDGREADNSLLDELVDLGLDLSREREARFNFIFQEHDAALSVMQCLTEDDFECEITEFKPNIFVRLFKRTEWMLTATKVMVVDCYIISELRTDFMMLLDGSGGEYDGWEVEVFPEEQGDLSP